MSLKLFIISTSPKSSLEKKIFNEAYSLYKEVWTPIFQKKFSSDSFTRFKCLAVIYDDLTPVAVCAYGEFQLTLKSHRDHSYFKDFPESFFDIANEENIDRFTTFEALAVKDSHRGEKNGIKVSNLISQICFLVAECLSPDILISPVVRTNKANEIGKQLGTKVLIEDIQYKGLNCDLMVINRGEHETFDDEITMTVVNELWQSKKDFIGLVVVEKSLCKLAA
jgi:hypothetical protein